MPAERIDVAREARTDFAQHATQEVREHIDALRHAKVYAQFMIPDAKTATGIRVARTGKQAGRVDLSQEKVSQPPHPALLAGLKELPGRSTLVQRVASGAGATELGLVLPAGFDVRRAEPYQALVVPPGGSLLEQLGEPAFHEQLERAVGARGGAEPVVVVVPSGANGAALSPEVAAYLSAHFNVAAPAAPRAEVFAPKPREEPVPQVRESPKSSEPRPNAGPAWKLPWNAGRWRRVNDTLAAAGTTARSIPGRVAQFPEHIAQTLRDQADVLRSHTDDVAKIHFGAKDAERKTALVKTEASNLEAEVGRWEQVSRDMVALPQETQRVAGEAKAALQPGALPFEIPPAEAQALLAHVRAAEEASTAVAGMGFDFEAVRTNTTQARTELDAVRSTLTRWSRAATELRALEDRSPRLTSLAQGVESIGPLPFGVRAKGMTEAVEQAKAWTASAKGLAKKGLPLEQLERELKQASSSGSDLERKLEEWKSSTETLTRAAAQLDRRLPAAKDALPDDEPAPFDMAAEPTRLLRSTVAAVDREVAQLRGKDLTASEARQAASELQRSADAVDEALGRLSRQVGTASPKIRPDPHAVERLPEETRAELRTVLEEVPAAKEAIELLATARPQVLTEVDSLTGKRFSEQLRDFVKSGLVERDEKAGFAEFLRRVAVRRFDWRRGGFSHSVCTSMNTMFNHPGLILDLIRTARTGKTFPAGKVYDGDGARELGPASPSTADFKDGFRPVREASDREMGGLPPATLGYERGFLRAIRTDLAPNPGTLPRERFAKLCDPVAIGLSKLTHQEVKYGYAFNLKTGDDLVHALESQKGEGLAFGDIAADLGTGMMHLHFPVFYDYDPKTRTVAMQEWVRGERRISVDAIRFQTQGNERPSLFYRPDPGMDRFLTPEFQSNWPYLQSLQREAAAKAAPPPEPARVNGGEPPAEAPRAEAPRAEPERPNPLGVRVVETPQNARPAAPSYANRPNVLSGEAARKYAPFKAPRLVIREVAPDAQHPQGGWEVALTNRMPDTAGNVPVGFVATLRLEPPPGAGAVGPDRRREPGKDATLAPPKAFFRERETQSWFIPKSANMNGVPAEPGQKVLIGTRGMGWFTEIPLPSEGKVVDSDQDDGLWALQPDQIRAAMLTHGAVRQNVNYW